MEFTGKVFAIQPIVTGQGARGEWRRQEVIFEQIDEFNRKICVNFWGDKTAEIANLQVGDLMSVSANVESREHNGRWYTEVRAWRIVPKATQEAPADSAPVRDMPFDMEPPKVLSSEEPPLNDLPF